VTDAIPTTYRGIRYRSRLEARWAAFFRFLQMYAVYEPIDLDGWIPDFSVGGALVEVKPCLTEDDFVEHELRYADYAPGRDIILVGVSPVVLGGEKFGRLRPKSNGKRWRYASLRYCPEFKCRRWGFTPYPVSRCDLGHTVLRACAPDLEASWARACTETQWRKQR